MTKNNYKLIIAIPVIAMVIGIGIFIWGNTEKTGIIEGSLSYPSDYIPKELKTCAKNQKTQKEYCTNARIYDKKYNPSEYTTGSGYKIEVPTGEYRVYSFLPDSKDWKAYYSNYVVCIDSGLHKNCNSHDPITVNVLTNQVISNINPGDWYPK